jgi:peptidoglycan L-alanyl-D-glutamate endopeptidase CwlK
MASRLITDLDHRLQPLAQEFLDRCAAVGLEAILIQTYRSGAEQDEDYARGRTTPGHRITNAKGGQSAHNCTLPDGTPAAMAFDFALYAPGEQSLDWNASDDAWHTAIQIGKDLGLVSGSMFHGIADNDHFELPGWRTAIRNVVALPLLLLAICLWSLADGLAKLSQTVGGWAAKMMEPRR